ncbi:MAG TPA: haloacid dehalogenase type II [Burkholderiales bacterium]|nr:haloacid dehalogenase type II [Burkholderiales bacterium]
MSLDALVFDAYGTLYDPLSVARRGESFWPGKGQALSALWRSKQLEYTWQRTLMQRYVPFSQVTREALAYACEALGLELSPQRMEALMGEYLMLACYPDVEAALGKLSGYRTAILTNGSPDMIEPLVQHSGLRFDAVLSVDAVKLFKPAPQVYELASAQLNVPARRIGFVSSNCWDAMGAKSFGFAVYWINRAGAPVDRLGFQPDGILKSLGDLPEVLL